MITIQNGKFVIPENERFIGFAGDNRRKKIEFLVKGEDDSHTYRLYLVFDDESVNYFVLPSKQTAEGTLLTWDILEGHLLKSGIVKAQLKAFGDDELIWHTGVDTFIVGRTAEFPEKPDSPINTEFLEYEKALNNIREEIKEERIKLPFIGENGNWYYYDTEKNSYVDSGKPSAVMPEDFEITPGYITEAMLSENSVNSEKVADGAISRSEQLSFDLRRTLTPLPHVYFDEEELEPEEDSLTSLGVYHYNYSRFILMVDSFSNIDGSHLVQWKMNNEGISFRTKLSPKYLWSEWISLGEKLNITVDSMLSSTSENPIQNKVVNEALGNKMPKAESFAKLITLTGGYSDDISKFMLLGQNTAAGPTHIKYPLDVIKTALTPVKDIDYFDGQDGVTPHIGSNGNWFIGDEDTGACAYGTDTFVPDYWRSAIDGLKDKIEEKQASGKDAFQFVWFSDMHGTSGFANTNGAGRSSQKYLGAVSQKVCEEYDIPFVAVSGDIMSQTDFSDVDSVHKQYAECSAILSQIHSDNLLMTIGNHDGAWGGSTVIDGVTQNYLKDIGNKALYNKVFRRQATDKERVFGEDGTYFYVDSKPQKIRFIMLNTNTDGDGSNDENGYAVYNSMKNNVLGSEQLQWLENVALDVPEGYGVIIMGHIQPKAWSDTEGKMVWNIKDGELLNGILTAYKNRSFYSGERVDLTDTYWGDSADIPVAAYTNLFDASEAILNTRINSSGEEAALDGVVLIREISCTNGDVIRINKPKAFENGNTKFIQRFGEGTGKCYGASSAATEHTEVILTDTDATITVGKRYVSGELTDITNTITSVTVALYLSSSALTEEDVADIIITKNEEIAVTTPSQSEYCISETADKDFTEAKGELIAYFHGHIHRDSVDNTWLPIPSISITTAGGDVRDTNPVERIEGTATETALDIVTVDKSTRTVYLTRLGAGNDRQVSY